MATAQATDQGTNKSKRAASKSDRAAKLPRRKKTLAERHAAMVDPTGGPDACWPWKGSRMQANGYGQIHSTDTVTGKATMRTAHTVALELHLGRPIADGMHVLHARGCCQECCNPKHLREGTREENAADAIAEKRFSKRLTTAEVLEIAHLYRTEGASIPAIATRFGVSPVSIRNIVRGKTHGDKTGIKRHRAKPGRPRKIQIVSSRAAIVPTASSTLTLQ